MGRGDRCERANRRLNLDRGRRREHPAAVEPSHAVGNDVGFGSRIESSGAEGGIDLVAELASAVFNALSGVKNWCKNLEAFFPEMLRNAAKIFKSELHAKAEDTVDQNDVHRLGS